MYLRHGVNLSKGFSTSTSARVLVEKSFPEIVPMAKLDIPRQCDLLRELEKLYFKQRRETFRRSKALDNPVFQKNPFVSIPSNDSLDEVFEENNNNRKESVISFETTKGKLMI